MIPMLRVIAGSPSRGVEEAEDEGVRNEAKSAKQKLTSGTEESAYLDWIGEEDMDLTQMFDSHLFTWVILPLLIFIARILDVTLDTIRIVFVSRGKKLLAPVFGFFEVLIWLLAIGQIMRNLSNVFCYLAYAGGFATGNFVGLYLEEKLAMGIVGVRLITNKDASQLIEFLRKEGYGVTSVDAQGASGKVNLAFMIIRRSELGRMVAIIQEFHPQAFYSVEDVRMVRRGIFPARNRTRNTPQPEIHSA